ncbi:unnamed protein product [Periconia digitata]|uniref:Nephrocystin 3-like N-terminal domain-containing protein n=1 Tax=Periconia digitata TaxID=1303443 RepID=A0A9W4UCI9_9PLEO|nr:unnamed protein product [Periconia digitata]
MDPVSAIGLAASLIQIIKAGTQAYNTIKEINRSQTGMTDATYHSKELARAMEDVSLKLERCNSNSMNDSEQTLCALAVKCRQLSEDIIRLSERLTNKSRSWDLLFWMVQYDKYEKEKLMLESKLVAYRDQLGIHMTYLFNQKTQEKLNSLGKNASSQLHLLQDLQNDLNIISQNSIVASLSSDALEQIGRLSEIPEKAIEAIARSHIECRLSIKDTEARFDNVETAHAETFRWILEEDQQCNDPALLAVREHLVGWLSNGSGYFHILGKPGSGKSTLMKFLIRSTVTRVKLLEWAGEHHLIMAYFFFWKPGDPHQKLLRGLMTSILLAAVQNYPGLTETLFPTQWKSEVDHILTVGHSHIRTKHRFREDEINDAFKKLLEDPQVGQSHRLCFFLDGLDEHEEESINQDHFYLVNELKQFISLGNGRLKMCLSSREENAFEFNTRHQIRLQDLTRKDMERFVRARLNEFKSNTEVNFLASEVTARAEGVFLWTSLVVVRLCECLAADSGSNKLMEELKSLPTRLKDLYKSLLNSISPSTQQLTYLVFSLILQLAEYRTTLPPLLCLFLEDYNEDPEFIRNHPKFSDRCRSKDEGKYQSYDNHFIASQKLIRSYCMGLVEIRGKSLDTSQHHDHVVFTHRSILEFLQIENSKEMNAHNHDFKLAHAYPRLLYATLSICGFSESMDWFSHPVTLSAVIHESRSTTDHDIVAKLEAKLMPHYDYIFLFRDRRLSLDSSVWWTICEILGWGENVTPTVRVLTPSPLLVMAGGGEGHYLRHYMDNHEYSQVHRSIRGHLPLCLLQGIVRASLEDCNVFLECLSHSLNLAPLDIPPRNWEFGIGAILSGYMKIINEKHAATIGRAIEHLTKNLSVEYFLFDCQLYLNNIFFDWAGDFWPEKPHLEWQGPQGVERYFQGRNSIHFWDIIQTWIEDWELPNEKELIACAASHAQQLQALKGQNREFCPCLTRKLKEESDGFDDGSSQLPLLLTSPGLLAPSSRLKVTNLDDATVKEHATEDSGLEQDPTEIPDKSISPSMPQKTQWTRMNWLMMGFALLAAILLAWMR